MAREDSCHGDSGRPDRMSRGKRSRIVEFSECENGFKARRFSKFSASAPLAARSTLTTEDVAKFRPERGSNRRT